MCVCVYNANSQRNLSCSFCPLRRNALAKQSNCFLNIRESAASSALRACANAVYCVVLLDTAYERHALMEDASFHMMFPTHIRGLCTASSPADLHISSSMMDVQVL